MERQVSRSDAEMVPLPNGQASHARSFMTKLLENTSSLLRSMKSKSLKESSEKSFRAIDGLIYKVYLEPNGISGTCLYTLDVYRRLRETVSAHPSVSLRGAMIAAMMKAEFNGIRLDELVSSMIAGRSEREREDVRERMGWLKGSIDGVIRMKKQEPIPVTLKSGKDTVIEDKLTTLSEVGEELKAIFGGSSQSCKAAAALECLRQ
ncbi:Uncharacterised protein [uncultured archaeon]|nr:Uncharacterised protein [uncultured archaeon]